MSWNQDTNGRWSRHQWKSWKRNQDWTPPKRVSNGNKKEERQAQVDAHLESVKTEFASPKQQRHGPPADLIPRNLDSEMSRTESMKLIAKKLKAALAMRAEVEEDPAMLALLDSRIAGYRQVARSGRPPQEAIQELMESLASARAKAERTAKHLALAKEQHEVATKEVRQYTEELTELRRGLRTSSLSTSSVNAAVLSMASSLQKLRSEASFTESGKVLVDPATVEQIATVLHSLANPVAPSSVLPPTTPSASEFVASGIEDVDVDFSDAEIASGLSAAFSRRASSATRIVRKPVKPSRRARCKTKDPAMSPLGESLPDLSDRDLQGPLTE